MGDEEKEVGLKVLSGSLPTTHLPILEDVGFA
jgi:hypothetical protein